MATGVRVEFEEWFEKEEGFLLPKVWVKVFGLRKKLREYLTLWAVGSLLGATQLVDMKTTRKNEFGRFFVAVLNPKLIPKMIDVVIGDHYFELKFEVEKKGVDENGEEVEFSLEDWDGDEEDGNSEGEEYKENNEGKERESKRTKNDDMAIDDNKENSERKENEVQEGGDQGREDVILEMAENVLDVAVERVLGEEYERVEREEEKIDGAVMQQEKVEQLANIEEVLVTPKRASERLMGSSGRHSLEKAKSRKVWMNLDLLSGNESKNSFLSFSQAHIVENLNALGLNLGDSSNLVSDSVLILKETEFLRSEELGDKVSPSIEKLNDSCNDEEEEYVDSDLLNHLCGDTMDEVMDDEDFHLSCEIDDILIKSYPKKSRKGGKRRRGTVGFKLGRKKGYNERNFLE